MVSVGPVTFGRVAQGRGGAMIPPPGVSAYGTPGPYVYDAATARSIPGVERALRIYTGLTKQMDLDAVRGYDVLPQPRLLAAPDPSRGGSWYVGVNVEDYLLSGNAVSLVTARGADGWPLAVKWLEAEYVTIIWWTWGDENAIEYQYLGKTLPPGDVIHVRRSADRRFPVRGVGIIEQHLSSFDRVAMEEEYERGALAGGAVPSVAVVTPNATVPQDVVDEAKAAWLAKFSGPQREPVILPNGTQVIPLAWSPTDTQLTEARRMSLQDVANCWNLDGYWLGSAVSGMTYKSAAPQYQQVLRTSLEPVLADFEDVWSDALLPRGTRVQFRRSKLLGEDLAVAAAAGVALHNAGLVTAAEARAMVELPPTPANGEPLPDAKAIAPPPPTPQLGPGPAEPEVNP